MRSIYRIQRALQVHAHFSLRPRTALSGFCWLLMALILGLGQGTLKGLCPYLPPKLKYWPLLRLVRSGQWEADILVRRMAPDVLRCWPPPADGVIHLRGDATRKDKRGQQHPLGCFRRDRDHAP